MSNSRQTAVDPVVSSIGSIPGVAAQVFSTAASATLAAPTGPLAAVGNVVIPVQVAPGQFTYTYGTDVQVLKQQAQDAYAAGNTALGDSLTKQWQTILYSSRPG